MRFSTILFFLLAAMPLASARLGAHRKLKNVSSQNKAIPGQYLVIVDDTADARGILNGILNSNERSKIKHYYGNVLKGVLLSDVPDQLLLRLLDSNGIKEIYEDAETNANEVQQNAPWGLDRVDARTGLDGAFTYNVDGSGVDIYILDTGVVSHSDFSARYKGCSDYTGEGCSVLDPNDHGTHVAGTAAGTTYGVAKEANLYNYKVLKSTGSGSFGWAAAAVDDIVDRKKANPSSKIVINMSLSGGFYEPMNDAVDNASASGVVVVVAAGNDSTDACTKSPASAVSAITVGATTSSDEIASFSNFGPCVNIYAPGASIVSAHIDGGSKRMSGTSMASPHVAGAAALYLAANKNPAVDMLSDASVVASVPFLFTGNIAVPAPTDAPVTPSPTDAPAPTDAPVIPAPTDAPVTPSPAPTNPPTTRAPTTCAFQGDTCSVDGDCCSNKCNGPNGRKKCVGGDGGDDPTPTDGPAPTDPPGSCGISGSSCSAHSDCCSNKCKGAWWKKTCN